MNLIGKRYRFHVLVFTVVFLIVITSIVPRERLDDAHNSIYSDSYHPSNNILNSSDLKTITSATTGGSALSQGNSKASTTQSIVPIGASRHISANDRNHLHPTIRSSMQAALMHSRSRPLPNINLFNDSNQNLSNYTFVVGIPTVYNKGRENYLVNTVASILKSVNEQQRRALLIVIMYCENIQITAIENSVRRNSTWAMINRKFPTELAIGKIRLISPPLSLYAPLLTNNSNCRLRRNFGDNISRVIWRSKLVLDAAYLFYETHRLGDIAVRLEDDVLPRYAHWPTIIATRFSAHPSLQFINLKTSSKKAPSKHMVGSYAWALRSTMVPTLTEFLFRNFDLSPLDWLVGGFLESFHYHQHPDSYKAIDLFKHIGEHSTKNLTTKHTSASSCVNNTGVVTNSKEYNALNFSLL